jgi:hypothetical protein
MSATSVRSSRRGLGDFRFEVAAFDGAKKHPTYRFEARRRRRVNQAGRKSRVVDDDPVGPARRAG